MEFFLLIILGALASNADTEKTVDVVSSPDVVVKAPADVAEAPAAVVEAPAVVTQAPAAVVEAPAVVTQAPQVGTEPKMILSLFSGRDSGVKTTSLSFGVPETDNVMFNASCRADNASATPISFDLSTSFGGAANLDNVNMLMRSGTAVQSYGGQFLVASEEYAAGNFQLAIDDPVLASAAQNGLLSFGTEIGVPALEAEFSNTKDILKLFLSDCAAHAQVAQAIEPEPRPATGGTDDGQTAKVDADAQADSNLIATPDPEAIVWRRERLDLGRFNEANRGLRGSILTATRNSEKRPIFRAYCSEDSVQNARTRLQFFSQAQLPAIDEEHRAYLKFIPGEEYLDNILSPLDATFTGRVVKYQDTSVVQVTFGATARFWSAMEVAQEFFFEINPDERRSIELKDAGRIVSQFRNDCLTYTDAAEAKVEAEKQASTTPAETSTAPTGGDAQPEQQVAEVQPAPEATQSAEIVPVAPVPVAPAPVAPQPVAPEVVTPQAVAEAPATPVAPVTPAPEGNVELPTAADPTKRWMASRGALNNVRSAFLRYGAAGGGETEFVAVCSAGNAAISSISTWHFISDFPQQERKRIKLVYVVDGENLTTTYGEVFDDGNGYEGIRDKNASFGKLYEGLAAGAEGAVQIGELGALGIPLGGSAQPIAYFIHDCKTLRDEAKAELKAAGNDKTPPEDPNWNNLSRTIAAALEAEENGVVRDLPLLPEQPKWSAGKATFKNKPFSYVRLDHKGSDFPPALAVCNASSARISNIQFWLAMDVGNAQTKRTIAGHYVFGDERQRKTFRPFGTQAGYRGVAIKLPYFGSFWKAVSRSDTLDLELKGVEEAFQYSLAGGHKMLLQFIEDCRAYRDEAKETEKTTGVDQVSDLVDPNQLVRLTSTGGATPQPEPAAPTQQTAAAAVGGVYRCDNGRQMQLALAPQNVAVKVDYQGLPTMELPSVDNNAGSSFSDGFFTLVANDAEARLIWGNTTRICKR